MKVWAAMLDIYSSFPILQGEIRLTRSPAPERWYAGVPFPEDMGVSYDGRLADMLSPPRPSTLGTIANRWDPIPPMGGRDDATGRSGALGVALTWKAVGGN